MRIPRSIPAITLGAAVGLLVLTGCDSIDTSNLPTSIPTSLSAADQQRYVDTACTAGKVYIKSDGALKAQAGHAISEVNQNVLVPYAERNGNPDLAHLSTVLVQITNDGAGMSTQAQEQALTTACDQF